MNAFVATAVLGAFSGGITSLLGVGTVVAYRGSQVVNFALGAIAMAGTYVFYSLHETHQVNYAVSFVAGVAVSGLLAAGMQVFILDRLRNSPNISKLIATLGVLAIIEQLLTHTEPSYALYIPSSLPSGSVHLLGAQVPIAYIIITGIAIGIALIIGGMYRYTQFGRATTAGLDNRRALSSLGYSPSRIAAVNWLISGCILGVGGILLAPIAGLAIGTYSLLVLPVLAAVVAGRFRSLTVAVVGGLALGVIQAELGRYISVPGWSDGAPFVLIIVILAIRGVGALPRTSLAQRLPRVGTGRLSLRWVVPVLIGLLVLTQVIHSLFWLSALVVSIGGAIVLLSFVIVTGYSGQLSLAQFAFAGLGAWVAGKLVTSAHLPLAPAVVIGILAVIPVGLIVGFVCLRTSGVNLAIATLAFAAAVEYLIFDSSTLTGVGGITLGNLSLFGWNINPVTHLNNYATVAVVGLALAAVVTSNLRRGIPGRRLLAVRANARAAASVGIDVTSARVYAFAVASAIAALGGIVLGFGNTTIVFSTFSTLPSVEAVAQSIVGGVGYIGGAAIGGLGQTGGVLTQALDQWVGSTYASYVPLALAVLLIVVLLTQPDGGAPIIAAQYRAVARKLGFKDPAGGIGQVPIAAQAEDTRDTSGGALSVANIKVVFGTVVAVDDVSLEVNPGEIVGLIGPNGAGKTTVIDAITGYVPYRNGSVRLGGELLDSSGPSDRARAGLTRSFQSLELFDDLRVIDNLASATDAEGAVPYVSNLAKPSPIRVSKRTQTVIREFELDGVLDKSPLELSYGTRRLLAMARAVAASPSVLLLDEPGAGLDEHERHELAHLLTRLAKEWRLGILLVEHDVAMVMGICDRIYALKLGQVIATGTPREVRNDPRVIEAFLGETSAEAGAVETGPADASPTAGAAKTGKETGK